MRKSTTIGTVSFLVVIIAIVGVYTLMSQKSRYASADTKMTPIQSALSRDLQSDYPPTVKEVIKYFTELQKCFYNEEWTDEELEQLGRKAWELFDPELQAINQLENYIPRLRQEIKDFHSKERQITSVSVAASTNVDNFEEDGYSFARIHCKYVIREDGAPQMSETVYLLRRDENRHWRIYGWNQAENVNPSGL